MMDPIAFAASNTTENLYYHQAMKALNSREFQKSIIMEVNDHTEQKHWELIPIKKFPKGENYSHPYGHSNARGKSTPNKCSNTRHASTSIAENKNTFRISSRRSHLL